MEILVIIGTLLTLLGIIPYVKDTLKGKTKPNRVTWVLWGISPIIGSIAAFSDGAGWSALPVFISGFICILVLIASYINPKSYWELKPFDYVCGLLSVLALFFWWVTKDPNIAIIFSIGSDFLAAVPTIRKAWYEPETETASPYIVGVFNTSTGILVATDMAFSKIGFNIYLMIMSLILSTLILTGKKRIGNKKTVD